MRAVLVAILALAALWRAGLDWQATIGAGYAYRLASIGKAIGNAWPESYADFVAGGERSRIPFVWDPVGETLLALPLAAVLGVLAALLWVGRARPKPR
jgi:hypothetical protein